MPTPQKQQEPLRLFLDSGVLVDGCFNRWGACKAVLILTTLRSQFRAVLADPVDAEFKRNVARKTARLPREEALLILSGVGGWIQYARPERRPWPTDDEMRDYAGLLSIVRHRNDMPSVVAAVVARPDWVLSTNADHWNQELARHTGLRISTPFDFLASLHP
jgi:hypothetical protein